jgi:hypothetical protein
LAAAEVVTTTVPMPRPDAAGLVAAKLPLAGPRRRRNGVADRMTQAGAAGLVAAKPPLARAARRPRR